MPYDVGVRQYLQGKGVANTDIGFDKGSGNVTVRGQNFYKPELNMANTTYSNQSNLDNAYSAYSKSLPVIQPDGTVGTTANTGQPTTQPVTQPATPTAPKQENGGYSNPYTSMIADVMKHLSDSYNAPQQDIYSSPQYAAAKANQDRQAANSIRHSNESAAGAGLGHSTIMTDRSQGIQNENDNYLATQLVPQIQAQLEQQRQAQIAQEQNQFNNLLGLSDRADNQYNSDRTFNYNAGQDDITNKRNAVNDNATYGGVYNPSGLTYEQAKSKMAENSAAYASASPDEQHRLHEENKQIGELLGQKFDTQTGTYSKDQGFIGNQTMQSKSSELSDIGQKQQNLLNQYKIDDYPAESKAAAEKVQLELKAGRLTNEAAEYNLKVLKDPNSPINLANAIDLKIKKLELENLPEKTRLELDNLKKTSAQIGVVHYKPQTAAEIAQDQVKLATATKQLADIQKGIYPGDKQDKPPEVLSAIDYAVKYVDSLAKYDDYGALTNGPAVESQILSSGKTDDEMRQMYGRYGLKWGD